MSRSPQQTSNKGSASPYEEGREDKEEGREDKPARNMAEDSPAVRSGGYASHASSQLAASRSGSRSAASSSRTVDNNAERSGAPLPASGELARKSDAHQSEGSTIALSLPDSSSEGSAAGHWTGRSDTIQWDAIYLGERIQPYRNYASCTDDIQILARFLELGEVADLDGDSVKLLLRSLKFLRHCDYSVEDICSIAAHASAYFIDVYQLCGNRMDPSEVGNVLATLMFLAHCFVQDETCPLRVWHQHLFRKYCPLKTLNAAILRLLEIRQYILRLEDQDLCRRFSYLTAVVRWNPQRGEKMARAVSSKETRAK